MFRLLIPIEILILLFSQLYLVQGQHDLSVLERLVIEMEKETINIENDDLTENATEKYDVIINDRESNDIEVSTNPEDNEGADDESDDSEVSDLNESVDDVNKLLAAQARAIEVFEMIKHLEVEMEEMLKNKTKSKSLEETTTTEPVEDVRTTTEKTDDIPETDFEEGSGDNAVADVEIEKLQSKVKLLREKGNRIKDAIIEQTKLLLSEESLLSRLRTKILMRSLRKMRNKDNQKTVTLSKRQQQFLISLQGLENLLNDLRDTDTNVRDELQQRKKVKKIKLSLPGKRIRKGKDSILDHPTIIGVDSLNEELEDYDDYDVPTIIVEEEEAIDTEPGTILVKDYEVDLDPIHEQVLVAVPRPAALPAPTPNPHGHVLHRPRAPHYQHPRYHEHYKPPIPPREQYHHHYESYRPYPQEPHPPHYPHYPRYPRPHPPVFHQPGTPPPPPPEPHITLTGELLAGFEHINGRFINA